MSIYDTAYRKLLSRLLAARKAADLSQEDVGELLGKHQTFVSKLEKGQRYLDVTDFVRWSMAVKLDPAELISSMRDDLKARAHRPTSRSSAVRKKVIFDD